MKNKQPSQKQLQVGEKIKRHLSQIFLEDNNLSFVGSNEKNNETNNFITINQVDISPDLRNMKIIIDSFSGVDKKKVIKCLNELKPYLKKKIATEINLRYIPEFRFIFRDEKNSIDHIHHILSQESKKFNNQTDE
jgi:ribosome-binding factor A